MNSLTFRFLGKTIPLTAVILNDKHLQDIDWFDGNSASLNVSCIRGSRQMFPVSLTKHLGLFLIELTSK